MQPDDTSLLTVGSYEGHLLGYNVSASAAPSSGPAFALRAHDGCVRAIAGGGALLATCGSDHAISVYNSTPTAELVATCSLRAAAGAARRQSPLPGQVAL